jgi:hypothetical protein
MATQSERISQLETIIIELQEKIEALTPKAPQPSPVDPDELNSIIREVWLMKQKNISVSVEDQELYEKAVKAGYKPFKEGHADLELFYKSEEYLNRTK